MRTIKRALMVAAGLALAGCASHQAHQVQAWAAGRSLAELEQCAGKPTATDALADDTSIAQWDYAEPQGSTSIPVPLALVSDAASLLLWPIGAMSGSAAVSVTSAGACHAIATVRDGRVAQLRYAGPNGAISGSDAVCAPIMRECLRP